MGHAHRPDSGANLRLLALGSSTLWCGVALLLRDPAGSRVVHAHEEVGNDHSRRILPMARQLLDGEGLGWNDLHALAFDCGPGSFTGLRIACGVAQGLAFALDVPVVAVSSLEALAALGGARRALAALDARMGEVYLAEFDLGDGLPRRVGPIRALPAQLATQVLEERVLAMTSADSVVAIGDAFERYPGLAQAMVARGVKVDSHAFPRADAIATIAGQRFDSGEAIPAERAAPMYVRDKVALDVDEQQRSRAARARRPTA